MAPVPQNSVFLSPNSFDVTSDVESRNSLEDESKPFLIQESSIAHGGAQSRRPLVGWRNSNLRPGHFRCLSRLYTTFSWRALAVYRMLAATALICALFSTMYLTGLGQQFSVTLSCGPIKSPFSGAFGAIPFISQLSSQQRRMTLLAIWNDDTVPPYMRHFFHTVKLNADSIDLVFINRQVGPESQCIDFEQARINLSRSSNIKTHCLSNAEFQRRHVDFLCSSQYGWGCDVDEHRNVTEAFVSRPDRLNVNFRPLHGYIFRDLLPKDTLYWGWVDVDMFLGDFTHYPFNVLSTVSLMTGHAAKNEATYLGGQLTVFNFLDDALATSWKKIPSLQSPEYFLGIQGTPFSHKAKEERFWSHYYLLPKDDYPAYNLSYVVYPHLHGDDKREESMSYAISGRTVVVIPNSLGRYEVEAIIRAERAAPVDELGGLGWTTGEDGSEFLLNDPSLSSESAKSQAMERVGASGPLNAHVQQGIVEDVTFERNLPDGWERLQTIGKLDPHPLTETSPQVMRTSLIHFKEQRPLHILRRLEFDDRRRPWERKLFRHHLKSKKWPWWEFPPFEITDNMVFRHNLTHSEAWMMGDERRNVTLFYRSRSGEESPIG